MDEFLQNSVTKIDTSIAAMIFVIATYLFGVLCEKGLYSAPTEISFAYVVEIEEGIFDDDYAGDAYVDDSKAVIVLNGTEYPQKECPNPAYYTGAKRVGAMIFETVDPYAPFTLPLTAHDIGLEVPMLALLGYFIKSLLWILLPLFGKKTAKA